MGHDPTKVLMGNTTSSDKTIDNRRGEIAAGLAVRLKADGTISVAAADGNLLGISIGRSLSGSPHTSIVRRGLSVPVLLTAAFTPTVGAQVHISDTTGMAIAAGAGATPVNAVYITAKLTGISEAGTNVDCALVDMPGGL